jgi:hypothetical protein
MRAQVLYSSMYANGFGGAGPMAQAAALRAQQGGAGASGSPGESPSGLSEGCQATLGTQQLLGPLGLTVDPNGFPACSPKRWVPGRGCGSESQGGLVVLRGGGQRPPYQSGSIDSPILHPPLPCLNPQTAVSKRTTPSVPSLRR